jgi:general secretion pathway protein G
LAGLIVSVAVVSLLAGILIPVVSSQTDDARRARAWAEMEVIAKAFAQFRADTKAWPGPGAPMPAASLTTTDVDLTTFRSFYTNPSGLAGWKGPYLDRGAAESGVLQVAIPATATSAGSGFLDPWGQPYRVFTFAPCAANLGSVMIVSRGPDGVVNSSANDVHAGKPAGDDLVKVVFGQ